MFTLCSTVWRHSNLERHNQNTHERNISALPPTSFNTFRTYLPTDANILFINPRYARVELRTNFIINRARQLGQFRQRNFLIALAAHGYNFVAYASIRHGGNIDHKHIHRNVTQHPAAFAADADKTITVGASATPHAEILEAVKDALAAEGYELKIVIYDDYVLPNTALEEGDLDANYFQHTPYLNYFNEAEGTHIVPAALVHYEPFGIYSESITDLKDLEKGATIVIPADDSNETRALLLLQQEGLIKIEEGYTVETGITHLDIADDGGFKIVPVQADTVPAQLKNGDKGTIAVINGNYALEAGYTSADAIALEDASGDAAQYYANLIGVREGEENSEKTQALVKALLTDEVKTFIEETYNGSVVAVF